MAVAVSPAMTEPQRGPARTMSSSANSMCSTASTSHRDKMCNKAPKQPDGSCATGWSKFLAAYQSGDWEAAQDSERQCPKSAKKVQVGSGIALDSLDFFHKYKYMAAPPAPKDKCKIRSATLARHGLRGVRLKPCVDRYVKHAKSVFKCEYASISIACSDGPSTVFLSSAGVTTDANSATNTLCDHAMLLGEEEVFVVPDLLDDWRFRHFKFQGKEGEGLRFYASAPVLLSNSDPGGEDVERVQVGRLVIMKKDAWMDFGEADADLLMDIAKMAEDALENEYLQYHGQLVQRMQKDSVMLSWNLNKATDEEMTPDKDAGSEKDLKRKVLLGPGQMQRVVDTLQDILDASAAVAIDVTNFYLQSPISGSSLSSSTSPRSGHYGAYPSMPWLSSSSSAAMSLGSDSDVQSPNQTLPDSTGDGASTPHTSPTASNRSIHATPNRANQRRLGLHSRSTSAAASLDEGESYNVPPGSSASIVAVAGDQSTCPSVSSKPQSSDICSFLTMIRRDRKLTKPQRYENRLDETSSEEEDEEEREGGKSEEAKNPLQSLLSPSTKTYCTIPIFENDRVQPIFLLLITFKEPKMVLECERMFMYGIGLIVGSTCLRQQARLTDRAQLDFIRSVQHELRTPLNGILGITDLLRQSLAGGDMTEKLDFTEDGLLASLLESIRLSGVNLSTILDDVLDFGAVTGVRGSQAPTTRIEEVDLVREVEDGCLDELEHIAMHERQDQRLQVYRGYYAVPTLVIKVDAELQTRFRTDRTKLRKILSKFVANALRYSNEQELVEVMVVPSNPAIRSNTDRWIDFIIQDTGMGMSQDFLANSLFKPFSKADSFSQGVGLGVTIAASLISQMGGRLHIQSEMGKGTRVQVSLPLGQRQVLVSRSSLSQLYRPFQVQTAYFCGFVHQGQRMIVELIQERLVHNGMRIVDSPEEADLVIYKETVLGFKSDEGDQETGSTPLPRPVGPKARVLVVTRNALRSRNSSILEGVPVWLFRPPFGPSSLDAMDEFLREESPVVLKSVPTPTPAAETNLKRVQEQQQRQQQKQVEAVQQDQESSSMDHSSDVKSSPINAAHSVAIEPSQTVSPIFKAGKSIEAGKNGFRVLVVEDNYVNMRLITAVLAKGGYSFAEAKDGIEAVEQYKAFEPSIVLLDISLPLQDGFEACLQMRAHQMVHVPKIIAVTALSSTEDKVKGLEVCGMDDWRTKPLSIKTLRTDLIVWKKEWDLAWSLNPPSLSAPDEVVPKTVAAN